MKNDLIVITFSQTGQAFKAWQALMMMRSTIAFVPDSGRLLERDRKGKVIVHHFKTLPASQEFTQTKFLDIFIEILFAEDHEVEINRLADTGLDEIFLRDVAKALAPDSSALVFYIPRKMLVDTHRILNILSLLNGTLYHANFPDEVEEAIMALEYPDVLEHGEEIINGEQ